MRFNCRCGNPGCRSTISDTLKFKLLENEILVEGTKYDKKAAAKLAGSGLFNEETSTKIVDALFKEDIHAFVHAPAWLEKYLIGIVNMLIKYCDGDRSKAQKFLTDSIEPFEEYLTYIKELRPTLDQKKQLELDKTFNEQMSYEDMLKELETIRKQRDEESAEQLKNAEFGNESDFELVKIDSYDEMNDMFGGRATGDGSSDKYAGGGGTAWCHTNSEYTYDSWVKGGKKFFVLANNNWENIPFDAESNKENPKDAYGNSLIAILVSSNGRLLKATLRCNHVGVHSNADNQYKTYAELSEVVGFNVEEKIKSVMGIDSDEDLDIGVCDHCEEPFRDDWDRHETPDGEIWCEDCFFDYYDMCSACGEVVDRDYMYWANDEVYCEPCFDDRYRYCDVCGDPIDIDEIIDTPGGSLCRDCFANSDYVECEGCHEIVSYDSAYNTDNGYYCSDCFFDSYFICSDCGEIFDIDDAVEDKGGWSVCQDCYDAQQSDEDDEE